MAVVVVLSINAQLKMFARALKNGQCSKRSETEAKAHDPSPELDISFTSSCACAIATSKGGFLGLLHDSKK